MGSQLPTTSQNLLQFTKSLFSKGQIDWVDGSILQGLIKIIYRSGSEHRNESAEMKKTRVLEQSLFSYFLTNPNLT